MSRRFLPRQFRLVPLTLLALAGCHDPVDQPMGPQVQFAQGDNGIWTVTTLADPGDGVCDDAECTLREAIAAAGDGDDIVFAASLQGDILLAGSELSIAKSLTIDGAGRIAVDAQGNSKVMSVGALSSPTVRLARLTLRNGDAERGGGMSVGISSLTLDRVTVSGSHATIEGGGLYIGLGTVDLLNSTIAGNSAPLGGGLYNSAGDLTVASSTVSNNDADQDGGGLFVAGGVVDIRATTISGNQGSIGGAITNGDPGSPSPAGGDITITSSTIVANSATTYGDGVVQGGSGGHVMVLANSIVAGNGQDDCAAPSNGLSSAGYNLTVECTVYFTEPSDLAVLSTQLFTQVLEQELNDNGGPTETHALIARGRAVDAGYCPGETDDQRGLARPVDDPIVPNEADACDIGAYELQGPVAVVADLMISQAVNKTSVKQGERLTYTIRVQNLGPETAPNVVVTDVLPSGATFYEVRYNKGTHTAPPRGETGTVTWSVGDLLDQANETAELTVTVIVKGKTTITNTASVTGEVSDPNPANNSASIKVSVASGGTGKAGGKK